MRVLGWLATTPEQVSGLRATPEVVSTASKMATQPSPGVGVAYVKHKGILVKLRAKITRGVISVREDEII